ncbi:hypothetical protein ES288_D03G189900v1 [Gossypium darwinii]|uniref:Uncharacterized protein n=1 Tax=Gossypium darwinii TaxID=34276 RepID=A0A5D2D8H9_GOSDA|nr:hypothetical protein ES288_D03G189900v1 [Gossypium darwinii]
MGMVDCLACFQATLSSTSRCHLSLICPLFFSFFFYDFFPFSPSHPPKPLLTSASHSIFMCHVGTFLSHFSSMFCTHFKFSISMLLYRDKIYLTPKFDSFLLI